MRFHRETRGAISVLVLLMVWCLVALIGLVWNTTEEAQKRAAMQTAADSMAHAAATWMARSVNIVNAQNMVISQDASTEIIWRAIPPVDEGIIFRLNQEKVILEIDLKHPPEGSANEISLPFKNDLDTIAGEYVETRAALLAIESAPIDYPDKQSRLQAEYMVGQALSALNWAENTYVNGQPPVRRDPRAPVRPGPPGPNSEGLAQLTTEWHSPAKKTEIWQAILDYINNTEMPLYEGFHNRTHPGVIQPVDQMMQEHEKQVYEAEVALARSVPAEIEAERRQLEGMYHADLTLATLNNVSGRAGPATVYPPLMLASDVPSSPPQLDSIRAANPEKAAAANLTPMVSVDPINPQTGNAKIWHPDVDALVPAPYQVLYGFPAKYTITGTPVAGFTFYFDPNQKRFVDVHSNDDDGWGYLYAAPLEQYILQRKARDGAVFDTAYMVPLDNDRHVDLLGKIQHLLGSPVGGTFQIGNLPAKIPADAPTPVAPVVPPATQPGQPPPPPRPPPPPTYGQIWVLPRLTAPPGASASYRQSVDLYNQNGAKFTEAIRNLREDILNFDGPYRQFTDPFADLLWRESVQTATRTVLKDIGSRKQFLVLSTYNLSPLPQWAKYGLTGQDGMWISAEKAIENEIMQEEMTGIISRASSSLVSRNPQGLGGGILDRQTLMGELTADYAEQAAEIADEIIRPAAHQMAVDLANEWVNRPWAYEISPPQDPVPPYRGVSPGDRFWEFSVISGARQNSFSDSRLLLTYIFGNQNRIASYAQGEAFNPYEFNTHYGGGERIDQVSTIQEVNYGVFQGGRPSGLSWFASTGEPRMWRVDSIAGWNWRSRLSLSDALYPALQVNDELRSYLMGAGVDPVDSGGLYEINLH